MINNAAEFIAWQKTLGPYANWTSKQRADRLAFFKQLPTHDRYLVQRADDVKYFVPENKSPEAPNESMSPSGKYKLVVTHYGTQPGAWNYSRGEVFRMSDNIRVADVKRNYSGFSATWLEDHNGHDLLITGEDYQGQTFCELDTGRMKSYIPDDAFEGLGWCWAGCTLLSDGKTLLVDGCFWACPYEYRFFDVSNPMEGWPELEIPEEIGYIHGNSTTCEIENGNIVWTEYNRVSKAYGLTEDELHQLSSAHSHAVSKAQYQNDPIAEAIAQAAQSKFWAEHSEFDDEDESKWDRVAKHIVKMRRVGMTLVLIDEWKSKKQQEKELRQEEYERKSNAQMKEWIANDLLLKQLPPTVKPSFQYPSLNMVWKGETNPAHFRVSVNPDIHQNRQATLIWGVLTGDVTLELWVRGVGNIKPEPMFPRTIEGILGAWQTAQIHINGGA